MLDETTTGRALERLRQLSGMSERAAARSLGVKPSILRSWECHRTSPDADEIARAAGVEPAPLSASLMELELAGRVTLEDGVYRASV